MFANSTADKTQLKYQDTQLYVTTMRTERTRNLDANQFDKYLSVPLQGKIFWLPENVSNLPNEHK